MKTRSEYFDNAKGILIFLVVFGHLIDLVCHSDSSGWIRYAFIVIWAFHMPAFIFIAGLFDHRRDKFPLRRVLGFLALGFALKIANIIVLKIYPGAAADPSLWSDKNFPWFMFALAAFITIAYITQKIHPAIVMITAIVLSFVAGYFSWIGDFLYLSRILVFFPIYFYGYLVKPKDVEFIYTRPRVRGVCFVGFVACVLYCGVNLDVIYKFRPLFTGRNPYSGWVLENHGALMRFDAYLIGMTIAFFFFGVVPVKKLPLLTRIGEFTLSIYALHYYPIFLLDGIGVIAALNAGLHPLVLLCVFAVIAAVECVVIAYATPKRKFV